MFEAQQSSVDTATKRTTQLQKPHSNQRIVIHAHIKRDRSKQRVWWNVRFIWVKYLRDFFFLGCEILFFVTKL